MTELKRLAALILAYTLAMPLALGAMLSWPPLWRVPLVPTSWSDCALQFGAAMGVLWLILKRVFK